MEPAIADLIRLAASEPSDAQARIEQAFKWQVERDSLVAKAATGGGFSLLVGLAFSLLKQEFKVAGPSLIWSAAITLVVALALMAVGIWRFWRSRETTRSCWAAVELYSIVYPVARHLRPYL